MLNNNKIVKLTRDVIIQNNSLLMNFIISINFRGHRDQFGLSELYRTDRT